MIRILFVVHIKQNSYVGVNSLPKSGGQLPPPPFTDTSVLYGWKQNLPEGFGWKLVVSDQIIDIQLQSGQTDN